MWLRRGVTNALYSQLIISPLLSVSYRLTSQPLHSCVFLSACPLSSCESFISVRLPSSLMPQRARRRGTVSISDTLAGERRPLCCQHVSGGSNKLWRQCWQVPALPPRLLVKWSRCSPVIRGAVTPSPLWPQHHPPQSRPDIVGIL